MRGVRESVNVINVTTVKVEFVMVVLMDSSEADHKDERKGAVQGERRLTMVRY
jgi:hypothetical protein